MPRCCAVTQTRTEKSEGRARMWSRTGQSLMASGRVPKMNRTLRMSWLAGEIGTQLINVYRLTDPLQGRPLRKPFVRPVSGGGQGQVVHADGDVAGCGCRRVERFELGQSRRFQGRGAEIGQ